MHLRKKLITFIIVYLNLVLLILPSLGNCEYNDFELTANANISVIIPHPIIFVHGFTSSNDYWKGINPEDSTAMMKILGENYGGYTKGNLDCDYATVLNSTNGDTKKLYNFSFYGNQYDSGAIGSNGHLVPKSESIRSEYLGLLNSASWAKRLAYFINKVLIATGSDKVDIVAHSMGGVVARAAIKWYDCKDKVHKLLMIATPNKPTGDSWYEGLFANWQSQGWMKNGELLELGVKYLYTFNTDTNNFDMAVLSRYTTFVDLDTGAEGKYLDLMNQGDWSQGIEYSVIAGNRKIILDPKDDSVLNVGQVQLEGAIFNPVIYASHGTIPGGIIPGAAGENSLTACTYTTEFIKRWIIDNSTSETGAVRQDSSYIFPRPWKSGSCYLVVGIDNYKKALTVRTDFYNINREHIEDKAFGIFFRFCQQRAKELCRISGFWTDICSCDLALHS